MIVRVVSNIIIISLVLGVQNSYAQEDYIYISDTTLIDSDTAFIFSDGSWQFLKNIPNVNDLIPPIKENKSIDTTWFFSQNWNNNRTYHKGLNLSNMKESYTLDLLPYGGKATYPVKNIITSHFKLRWGRWHQGIDIRAKKGTPVYAAFDGKIRYSKMNKGGYGNLIIIRHYNGLETYYAHLSKSIVSPNQYVKSGDLIGYTGTTGGKTGYVDPHLHFETRFIDNSFNPGLVFNLVDYTLIQNTLEVKKQYFNYRRNTKTQVDVKEYTNGESNQEIKPQTTQKNKRRRRNPNGFTGTM